ncbi:glycerophosphodiester phosphodiesterase family protein [Sphingosinicella sp. CPCC 101087]|uniref:glycerophosphodiester phosphodiesterase family protein n=1 Tax=Sphingosinicella sp. CPCC 101087 TaxID=2497754 RepID=UPI00101BF44D|nr:glycerophosphodiester phosphodiesterase family protein [Sphingosinicella sp. CPCC 101087]
MTFNAVLAVFLAAAPVSVQPAVPLSNGHASAIGLLKCLADNKVVLSSGHRGGPAPGYPENAIETFTRTLAQAPVLIEVDVRATRDGVLVLMHDSTLDRTTTGEGKVADRSWSEIQALRLVDNDGRETAFRVPTLEAAIAAIRGRGILVIDVKEDRTLPGIARAIAAADARAYTMVNLYRPSQARTLHRIDPEIAVTLPVQSLEDLEVLRLVGVNVDQLAAWTGLEGIDERAPALWAELGRRGIPAMFGTLFVADRQSDDGSLWRELADMGVDVIPSDRHLDVVRALSTERDLAAGIRACESG